MKSLCAYINSFFCCFKKKSIENIDIDCYFCSSVSTNKPILENVSVGPLSDVKLSDLSIGSDLFERENTLYENNETL
jgi:hypothetical protein